MRYILLVTSEDGTELAFGPISASTIDGRVGRMQNVFPADHVRSLALLTVSDMHAEPEGGEDHA